MNKIINVILALCLILSMTACAGDDNGRETTSESTVVTTPESTDSPTTPEASDSTPESKPDSTPESAPESTPKEELESPDFDYMDMDLTEYIILGEYKGIEIKIGKKPTLTDKDIMDTLNFDLIYYGSTETVVDRAVTKDDTVYISYVGLLNGVAFEGGTGEADNFTIYDGGGFIDGFAEGLIGVMPGVETDLNLTFPENYHSADLAGKEVVFKVTVKHIYEAKELTDALTEEITGGQFKTADALIEDYRTMLTEEIETEYAEKKFKLAWEAIESGITTVKSTDEIVNAYFEYEISQYKEMSESYGIELDLLLSYYGTSQEALRADVAASVNETIILYSIIKAENKTLTDEEYDQFIADLGYTEEELLEYYTEEELREAIIASITYDSLVEWQNFVEIDS